MSIVFHPLLMVIYGVVLVFAGTYPVVYPFQTEFLILSWVFLMTAIGGIMGIALVNASNSWRCFIGFLIADCVETSRPIRQRHTSAQVYGGFGLGFTDIYISSLLSYFYFSFKNT